MTLGGGGRPAEGKEERGGESCQARREHRESPERMGPAAQDRGAAGSHAGSERRTRCARLRSQMRESSFPTLL